MTWSRYQGPTVLWTLHIILHETHVRRRRRMEGAWCEISFQVTARCPEKGRKEGYYVSGGAVLHAGWEDFGFTLLDRMEFLSACFPNAETAWFPNPECWFWNLRLIRAAHVSLGKSRFTIYWIKNWFKITICWWIVNCRIIFSKESIPLLTVFLE